MDAEKNMPPSYPDATLVTRTIILKPRTQKVLLIYAAAITAMLVTATVLGGVYYCQSLMQLQAQSEQLLTEIYKMETSAGQQKYQIDADNQEVVMYPVGVGVPNGTIVTVDYRKSIIGVYDPEEMECYLVGGLDSAFPTIQQVKAELLQGGYLTDGGVSMHYAKVANLQVRDYTVVTPSLRSICQGLPVYWLSEVAEVPTAGNVTTTAPAPVGRAKRGFFSRIWHKLTKHWKCILVRGVMLAIEYYY